MEFSKKILWAAELFNKYPNSRNQISIIINFNFILNYSSMQCLPNRYHAPKPFLVRK